MPIKPDAGPRTYRDQEDANDRGVREVIVREADSELDG
jgi:hypothetical protein